MATKWPAIPKLIQGAGGPIAVRLVKRIHSEKDGDCWGQWDSGTRMVRLERSARIQHKWRVLFHELTHAAMDDAGIAYLLSTEACESICEAMASARVQEMRGLMGLK